MKSLSRWLLPLILACLPVLVLIREWALEAADRRETEIREAQERSDFTARALRDCSGPAWPLASLVKTVRRRVEEALIREGSERNLPDILPRILAGTRNQGYPGTRWWGAVDRRPTGPDRKDDADLKALEGKEFVPGHRRFFLSVFREILRRQRGVGDSNVGTPLEKTLRGVWGFGFSGVFLEPAFRGVPFHVIFSGENGLAAWDIITWNGRPVGIIQAFMPLGPAEYPMAGLKTLLRKWRRLDQIPVFLPLPAVEQAPAGQVLMPPRLNTPEIREILQYFSGRWRVGPPTFPGDEMGEFDLQLGEVGKMVPFPRYFARLFPLAPETGRVGLLLVRRNRSPFSGKWAGALLLGALAAGWFAVSLLGEGRRRYPRINVRNALFLWFLGVISVPLLVGGFAGLRAIRDHERTLIDLLERKLEEMVQFLEQKNGDLLTTQKRAIRLLQETGFKDGSSLLEQLERSRSRGEEHPRVLTVLKNRALRLGLPVKLVWAVGAADWKPFEGSLGLGEKTQKNVMDIFAEGWAYNLVHPASGPADAAGGPTGTELMKTFTGILACNPNVITKLWMSSIRLMSCYFRVNRDANPAFVVGIIWDQDPVYREYLHREIWRLRVERFGNFSELGMELFRRSGSRLESVTTRGDQSGLRALALEGGPARLVSTKPWRGNSLGYSFPSRVFPDYVMTLKVSLREIQREIGKEKAGLFLLLSVALLLSVLTARALAEWVVGPILRMSDGLKAIAEGNLEISVAEPRLDELGEAGRTLDGMTAQLRERRKITRFVSPRVLNLLSGFDLGEVSRGQRQTVTMLVSDIRSFTTLSETHPPEVIFRLLNTHLGEMTQVISRWGGMIDRFIGDAIVAVFFAAPGEDQAKRAVGAAQEMMRVHRDLNRQRPGMGLFPFEIGIGLASGEALAGVLGDESVRLDYTILGEIVHQAAERESLSRNGSRSRIVVGEEVRRAVPELAGGPLGESFELDIVSTLEPPATFLKAASNEIPRVVPRPVSVTGQGTSRPRLARAVLLWFLPLLLGLGGILALGKAYEDGRTSRARFRLQDDSAFLQRAYTPERMVGMFLRRYFQEPEPTGSKALPQLSDEARWDSFRHRMATLEELIPGTSWAYLENRALPKLAPTGPELPRTEGADGFLFRGLFPGGFSQADARNFLAAYGIHLRKTLGSQEIRPQALEEWISRFLRAYLGRSSSPGGFLSDFAGRVEPVAGYKDPRCFFWNPVWRHQPPSSGFDDFEDPLVSWTRGRKSGRPPDQGNQDGHLLGFGLCLLPGGGFAETLVASLAIGVLDRRETAGLIRKRVDLGPPTTLAATAEFFRSGSPASLPLDLTWAVVDDWLVCRVLLSEKEGIEGILGLSRPRSPLMEGFIRGGKLAILLWLVGGLLGFVGAAFRGVRPDWISLERQLTLGFLVTVLPVFFLGMTIMSRAIAEREIRLDVDSRKTLPAEFEKRDAGFEVADAYFARQLKSTWDGESFRKSLNQRISSQPSPQEMELPELGSASRILLFRGLLVANQGIAFPNGAFGFFPHHKEQEKRTTARLFSGLAFETLPALGWTEGKERQDDEKARLAVGYQLEEFREYVKLTMDEKTFCAMAMSPLYFGEWILGKEDRQLLFRQRLYSQGSPFAEAFATWRWNQYERELLRSLVGTEGNPWRLRFGVSLRSIPSCFTYSPIQCYRFHPSDPELAQFLGWHRPDDMDFSLLAEESDTSLMAAVGSGEAEKLRLAFVPRKIGRFILDGELPLGAFRAELSQELRWFFLLFAGLLLGAGVLALVVARRFFEPIAALRAGCLEVARGEFGVRLSLEHANEFGVLARSFNDMAVAAQEGRLLGKFVSETVRAVARDESLEKAATAGEQIDAVVVFVALEGFKSRFHQDDPAAVVAQLNGLLRRFARILRDHQGEIDKFIGDKILGVFKPAPGVPLQTLAHRALQASGQLLRAMNEAGEPGIRLGVGITAGPVLSGIMGTPEVRLEMTVIGDTVNLAARLGDLASRTPRGAILVDGEMAGLLGPLLSQEGIRLQSLDVKKVKGKTREVDVLQALWS